MTRRQILRQGIMWSRRPATDIAIEDIHNLSAFLDTVLLDWTQPYRVLPLIRRTGITTGVKGPVCIPPGVHWIDSATITQADGVETAIRVIDSVDAGAMLGAGWRYNTDAAQPIALITEGPQIAWLYPTPNYTDTDGLTIYGRGTLSADMWPSMDDECPLQVQHHMGLAACITDFILSDSEDWAPQGRVARYALMAKRAKATFIEEAGQLNMSAAHRSTLVGSAGGGFNPFSS